MSYNTQQRREMAKLGQALPDGSYPIKTRGDLRDAIRLVGLGNAPDKVIKDHIIKRAKAIGAAGMIPLKWLHSDLKQSDVLEHFGIKGMHWGVRKASSPTKRVSESHTFKSRSGETITLEGQKTSGVARTIARVIPPLRDKINN